MPYVPDQTWITSPVGLRYLLKEPIMKNLPAVCWVLFKQPDYILMTLYKLTVRIEC